MSTDTIAQRSNGQVINETWFNVLRTVLSGDVVGRVNGVATTGQALGTAVYRWGNMSLEANIDLYTTAGTLLYRLTQSSGDYILQDGSANEIGRLTSLGWLAGSVQARAWNASAESTAGAEKEFALGTNITSATYTTDQPNLWTVKLNIKGGPTSAFYPVVVGLRASGSGPSYIQWVSAGGGPSVTTTVEFLGGGAMAIDGVANMKFPPSTFHQVVRATVVGSFTLNIGFDNTRLDTINVENVQIYAYQL